MNPFFEAIGLYFLRYTDFYGRSSRREFWFARLFVLVVGEVISHLLPGFSWLWAVAVLVPDLAIAFRRLHDIGRSGVWLLIGLIPIAGWIILLVWFFTPSVGDNQYGPAPVEPAF